MLLEATKGSKLGSTFTDRIFPVSLQCDGKDAVSECWTCSVRIKLLSFIISKQGMLYHGEKNR